MNDISPLQKRLLEFKPILPKILQDLTSISIEEIRAESSNNKNLKELFPSTYGRPIIHFVKKDKKQSKPLRVGVVFSGGQAPGGHNVITGLYDALMQLNDKSELLGFLNGPSGIIEGKYMALNKKLLDQFRNVGGFDLIGSGRTKIETPEQLLSSEKNIKNLNLDGLVIIGGDDSNTNAAILAEFFKQKNLKTKVVGVPKTIDGDLKNEHIEISFGFDTACKVYAELIGNIARDALSAKKYYHFIKLMGRSASHIALECALATHPTYTIIAEEVFAKKKTLAQITNELVDLIIKRSENKKNYGVVLIPEGLIEFIPEVKTLIEELNKILALGSDTANKLNQLPSPQEKILLVNNFLTKKSLSCFLLLPQEIQLQLLLDRDPHGNVQVSQIETEKLLIHTVTEELSRRNFKGKFNAIAHFFGYEGRAANPSRFDAKYCYALGHIAALTVNEGLTGYICSLKGLNQPIEKWEPKAIPLTCMMNLEMRHGAQKPVIKKALVDLSSKAFKYFEQNRPKWQMEDCFIYPGPIQYFGDDEITGSLPRSLI